MFAYFSADDDDNATSVSVTHGRRGPEPARILDVQQLLAHLPVQHDYRRRRVPATSALPGREQPARDRHTNQVLPHRPPLPPRPRPPRARCPPGRPPLLRPLQPVQWLATTDGTSVVQPNRRLRRRRRLWPLCTGWPLRKVKVRSTWLWRRFEWQQPRPVPPAGGRGLQWLQLHQ